MELKSKDPGGEKSRIETWSHHKVPGGTSFNAHIAGDTFWVDVHHIFRSIPCFALLTDGKEPCPYCKVKPRVDEVGYVPLYSDSGKPVFVVVPSYSRDVIARLKFKDPVRVRRNPARGEPVIVESSKWSEPYKPTTRSRESKADIRPGLLVVWKEPRLVELFGGASVTPVSQVPKGSAPDVVAIVDESAADLTPDARAKWHRAVEQSMRRQNGLPVLGEIIPPGKNGTGHGGG